MSTETARARQVELILQQVDSLPTLSPIATRLLSIGSSEDVDLRELARLIEGDPGLTAKVLSLCRRADKGLGDSITGVQRAITMLGLDAVRGAVLSVDVYELLSGQEQARAGGAREARPRAMGEGPTFDRVGFWKHSLAVACAAELIARAESLPGARAEAAFVAGLLHDLGRIVLDLVLPQSYAKVLAAAEQRRSASGEIERRLIGLDHYTAGKRIAERWGLPHAVQDVIWLHNQPHALVPELAHKPLVGVVTVARALCRSLHLGWSGDYDAPPELGALCAEVGLRADTLAAVAPRLHESVAERVRALGIEDQTPSGLLLSSIAEANRRLARMNATLERRGRLAQQHQRVLDALVLFHAQWRPGRTVMDTVGEVVRSASGLMGPGFYAAIVQTRRGDPWQVCEFDATGRALRTALAEPPSVESSGPASLAALSSPSQVSMANLALLPWLSDYVSDAIDLRRVRLLPLDVPPPEDAPASDEDDEGVRVVLLHDRPIEDALPARVHAQAIVAAWSSAVQSAAQHEGARRLGEQLAQANRSLTAAQSQLAEAQALARLGEMTSGAAHEMNNPLTVISGYAQLLATRLRDADDQTVALAIVQASQKLSDLITSLHLIADPPRPRRERTNLLDLLSEAVKRARGRSSTLAQVRLTVPDRVPSAWVDREFLTQAVVELVANAVEAEPSQIVDVRVQVDPLDDRLLIVVKDKGPGMSPAVLSHAFDPFFSQKRAGRQPGLGLPRARSFAELHGGEVTLTSAPGAGTSATIALPNWRAPDSAEVAPAVQRAA